MRFPNKPVSDKPDVPVIDIHFLLFLSSFLFQPIYCSAKVTYQPSTNPLFPYKREIARISVICRVAGTVDLRDMCIGTCVMTKHDIQYNCVYVDNK